MGGLGGAEAAASACDSDDKQSKLDRVKNFESDVDRFELRPTISHFFLLNELLGLGLIPVLHDNAAATDVTLPCSQVEGRLSRLILYGHEIPSPLCLHE